MRLGRTDRVSGQFLRAVKEPDRIEGLVLLSALMTSTVMIFLICSIDLSIRMSPITSQLRHIEYLPLSCYMLVKCGLRLGHLNIVVLDALTLD